MNAIRFLVLGVLGAVLGESLSYDNEWLFGAALGLLVAAVWRLSERVTVLERERKAAPAAEAEEEQPAVAHRAAMAPASSAPAPAPATLHPSERPTPAPTTVADEELFTLELPPDFDNRPTAPVPVAPAGDDLGARLHKLVFGGNPVVRAGLVVLFFGVAFLLKFAAERQVFPVEVRYLGVVAGALALLVVGWRQRLARPGFALLAQGGAVGLLYITVFAALRLHDLIPAPLAFALLLALVALSATLAVLQDSCALAVAGAAGGFLAPILVSTGSGNHVGLFSYYALLNAGVLGIAWYRSWRVLNLVGFVFTFGIGTLWGFFKYQSDLFWTTEPFLILFFLMYVVLSVLRATRQPPQLRGYVDGTLVFGLPVIAFGLQAGLVREIEFGLAWSALGMAALYLGLAVALWRRTGEGLRLLVESFLALGVVFGSLAIPLALEGRWTTTAWALEGAALIWIGVRQGRLGARLFGLLLQLGAGLFFFDGSWWGNDAELPLLNARFLGGFTLAIAGLLSAWHLRIKGRLREEETALEAILLGWGLLWWFGVALSEAELRLSWADHVHGYAGIVALSALLMSELSQRLRWRTLAMPLAVTGWALLFLLLQDAFGSSHPFARFGFLVWGVALASLYAVLRRQEPVLPARIVGLQHETGFWMVAVMLGAEASWGAGELAVGHAWELAPWAMVPMVLSLLVIRMALRIPWPFAAWAREYRNEAPLPVMGLTALLCLVTALASEGDPAPLFYVPLLNPLELAQLFVVLGLVSWRMAEVAPASLPVKVIDGAIGIVAFAVLNGMLARAVHFYTGVPFAWDELLHSTELQTAFAVTWTLVALALTVAAARLARRVLWMTGAALLALVVAKLFLVDLANSNTIERIVSFLGVGALMLAIGYFAPLPPAQREEA